MFFMYYLYKYIDLLLKKHSNVKPLSMRGHRLKAYSSSVILVPVFKAIIADHRMQFKEALVVLRYW